MKKSLLLSFLLVLGFSASAAFAYVDCRDSTGCSVEQLVSLCQNAPTSVEDRTNACKEAINKIQEKIVAMSSIQTPSNSSVSACLDFKNNLLIGKRDADTNGEVSKLQRFLIGYGFLSTPTPTGYYGQATAQAVYRYQTEILKWNWATPASGVGPKTRAELAKVCSSDATITGTYNWDSAGMTGFPDSFTPYGEVGTLHFMENQNQVRMKVFGTTTLPNSGGDSCSLNQENVKLLVSIVPPSRDIVIKNVLSSGALSPRKCATPQ